MIEKDRYRDKQFIYCLMEKEKKTYYVSVTEAVDGKMKDVMSFDFCCHHDLCAMVGKVKESGVVDNEKHAQELVLGMRLLHHAIKKNPECELFQSFRAQFKEFKEAFKKKVGCDCNCTHQG